MTSDREALKYYILETTHALGLCSCFDEPIPFTCQLQHEDLEDLPF